MKKLSITLFALSLLASAMLTTKADAVSCDVLVIDVATTETKPAEAASPDVYVIGDAEKQIGLGSVFRVFRHKNVIERPSEEHELRLYVGKLQIIDVRNNVWVGRMIEFAPREDYPRLRYETIMIGDCLELESPGEAIEISSKKSETGRLEVLPVQIPAAAETPPPSGISAEVPMSETAGTAISAMGEISVEREKATRYLIPTKILFAFDSSRIDDKWADELRQLAEFIIAEKPARVIVEGHTCSIGTEAYNLGLSRRRAKAVVDYLTSKFGLDKKLFEVQAFGETRPEASNETEEGRRKNRRAETSVLVKVIPAVEVPPPSKITGPTVEPEKLIPEDVKIPTIPPESPAVSGQP